MKTETQSKAERAPEREVEWLPYIIDRELDRTLDRDAQRDPIADEWPWLGDRNELTRGMF